MYIKEIGTMVFCIFVVNSVLAKPLGDLGKVNSGTGASGPELSARARLSRA
jgi:hypothetical protein